MPECPHCRQPISDTASYCENCGAPLTAGAAPPSELTARIRELLAADKKIEAIRVLREATGVDLAEAKRLVEAEADVIAALPVGSTDDEFDRELLGLVRAGRKIEAIKRHRGRTRFALKESKDYVEALAARHGIVPAKSGCAGVLVQ